MAVLVPSDYISQRENVVPPKGGRQVDVPVADSDNAVLEPLEDGRRNVQDVVPASPQPKPKPRVNKGMVVKMVFFEFWQLCCLRRTSPDLFLLQVCFFVHADFTVLR